MPSTITSTTLKPNASVVTRPVVRRRQINWRLLAATVIVLALLAPAVYLWHQTQLARVADALLAKADQMETDGNLTEASAYLYRYLKMTEEPSADLLARVAATYDRSVTDRDKKGSVIGWYYRAVAAAPEDLDLRVRLGELFLETNQYVLALEEADHCLAVESGQAGAMRVRALARAGQYQRGRPVPLHDVVTELEAVNRRDPGNLAVAELLASLYRTKLAAADGPDRAQQADRVMDQMVQNNPDRKQAFLARHKYRVNHDLPGANDDLLRALDADPKGADVVFAAADAAQRRGDLHEAERLYRHAVEHLPHDYRGHLGLGDALWQLGQGEEAIEVWQKATGTVQAGRLPLMVRTADAQIGIQQLSEAAGTITQINDAISHLAASGGESQRGWAVASRDLLQAKLAIKRGEYEDAVSRLRRITTTARPAAATTAEASLTYQACLLLGQSYMHRQQWEDAAKSFERSLLTAPKSGVARMWAARCWNMIGRHERAVMLCEQATQQPAAPESVWIMLSELRLREQLRQPQTERDWNMLRSTLRRALGAIPRSWEIQLLQATQLIASQPEDYQKQAARILAQAESSAPDSLPMWTRLIFLYDALERRADADRAVTQVGRMSDNQPLVNLYKAVLYARRGDYQQAQVALSRIDTIPAELLASVARVKLMVAYSQGDHEAARELLYQRLESDPERTDLLAQLAELAVLEHDWDELDQLVSQLNESEGSDGVLWRFFQAQRLLESGGVSDGAEVENAVKLIGEIRGLRPWWIGSQLLHARLAELRGNDDLAIDGYADVLRAGLQQANVYLRLMRLLHKQGRFTEADEWMEQLQEQQPLDPQYLDLAWSSAPDRERLQLALQVGRRNVELHPDEAVARIWMAQMLLLAGRSDEAVSLIREAERLDLTGAASASALLSFYLGSGDRDKALAALESIQRNDELPAYQRHWIAAQAYRQMGDPEKAHQQYQQALDLDPNRAELQIDFARYLRPADNQRAEAILRDLLRRSPDHPKARRLLATWLHWDVEADDEARALLMGNNTQFVDPRDRRLDALLRMRRGTAGDLTVARQHLEQLVQQGGTAEDHRLLAQLYDRLGEKDLATVHWRQLVERPESTAHHLGGFVDFLLRNGQTAEAERWLSQLEVLTASGFEAFTLRLRMMVADGQTGQLPAFVADYVRKRRREMSAGTVEQRLLYQIAALLESLKQTEEAERWLVELSSRYPDEQQALILFWVRQGQADRALAFCERAIEEDPTAENAALLTKVLVRAGETSAWFDQHRDRLAAFANDFPSHAGLLFDLANLYLKVGDSDRATELLRTVTQIAPQYPLAWNNLAAILAEDEEQYEEALACINQALTVAGRPVAMLLDTKAVLLLKQTQVAEAAALLSQAVSLPDGVDSRFHFHLALANQRLGNELAAADSMRRAAELGLDSAFLTEYEQQWLRELDRDLAAEVPTEGEVAR